MGIAIEHILRRLHRLFQVAKLAVTAQEFHMVIEKGEDGYYVASVVELPGCHTQARDLNDLDERVKEAITVYLEAEGKNLTVPEFVALKKIRI
jgi:predicted RNase H-like HicB family nuclease